MRVTITLSETASAAFSSICNAPVYHGIPAANVAASVFNAGLAVWENSWLADTTRRRPNQRAAEAAAGRPKAKKKGKA